MKLKQIFYPPALRFIALVGVMGAVFIEARKEGNFERHMRQDFADAVQKNPQLDNVTLHTHDVTLSGPVHKGASVDEMHGYFVDSNEACWIAELKITAGKKNEPLAYQIFRTNDVELINWANGNPANDKGCVILPPSIK